MAAAFFLFAAVGLQSSLIKNDGHHIRDGLIWAFFSGLIAVAYVVVLTRKPILLPLLILFQIVGSTAMARLMILLDASLTPRPLEMLVPIYALLTVLLTAAAYSFFLTFISIEGRFAFRAQTELALAHGIQQTLAPVIDLKAAGCELYGVSVPSDKVGGDLVDVVLLPDNSALAYIADIAGHGLQAGILMGMVKTAVRTRLLDISTLPDLFDRLNRVLPIVKEQHMYATAAALILKPGPHGCGLEYALAGHPPILHISALEEQGRPLSDEQFPLGLLPLSTYRSQTTLAAPGDLIVITTDGVLEVCNGKDLEFGPDKLQFLVIENIKEPLPALANRILDATRAWGKQEDDQTLLLIRVL